MVALTPVTFLQIGLVQLRTRLSGDAEAALALARVLTLETVFLREALFAVGRQSGAERLYTFFAQTYQRLVAAGLASQASRQFDLPLSQEELGRVAGLTAVHVNRTLKQLREGGLVDFRGGVVRFLDLGTFERIGRLS